jgi:hypothetical protein
MEHGPRGQRLARPDRFPLLARPDNRSGQTVRVERLHVVGLQRRQLMSPQAGDQVIVDDLPVALVGPVANAGLRRLDPPAEVGGDGDTLLVGVGQHAGPRPGLERLEFLLARLIRLGVDVAAVGLAVGPVPDHHLAAPHPVPALAVTRISVIRRRMIQKQTPQTSPDDAGSRSLSLMESGDPMTPCCRDGPRQRGLGGIRGAVAGAPGVSTSDRSAAGRRRRRSARPTRGCSSGR